MKDLCAGRCCVVIKLSGKCIFGRYEKISIIEDFLIVAGKSVIKIGDNELLSGAFLFSDFFCDLNYGKGKEDCVIF